MIVTVPRAVVVLLAHQCPCGAWRHSWQHDAIERLLRTPLHMHGTQSILQIADGAHRTDAFVTAKCVKNNYQTIQYFQIKNII